MITGHILSENSREYIECYAAGTNGNLPLGAVPCPTEGGRAVGLEWALPCSTNGVTLTGFDYQLATDGTKPRADAVKVLTVEDTKHGGSYKRVIVVDGFTIADYVEACCDACETLADVTVVEPFILQNANCYIAPATVNVCSYEGSIYVAALTGGATTFTATPLGFKADGTAITFAPSTSTGTTVALLAANMQTNWASELGTGTFVATGNLIEFNSTNGAKVAFSIAQS